MNIFLKYFRDCLQLHKSYHNLDAKNIVQYGFVSSQAFFPVIKFFSMNLTPPISFSEEYYFKSTF